MWSIYAYNTFIYKEKKDWQKCEEEHMREEEEEETDLIFLN